MFEDIPVDVGIIYEGERIRGRDMQIELGGPREEYKFELVQSKPMDEIDDGKITIVGRDISELPEGTNTPFGMVIEVGGAELEKDLEGVIERRLHEYVNFIEGFMHLNQRYDIQMRLSKKSYLKGFNSFNVFGEVLMRLYKSELPFIEKMQITFYTDPEKVEELYAGAIEIYDSRDARARGMSDDEVDVFYGCSLCQSFAPTHLCVITPQRYANCGAISWFDGRATAKVDPKGPVFEILKGALIDAVTGEYEGVNQVIRDKSLGEIERVQLYTAFGYPHTSCGCFEGCAFYIPEVDGYGVVHRNYKSETVNGLSFVTISDLTAGGRQVDGFHGLSIEYMRSPKFLQADGGWDRVVWMPKDIMDRIKQYMPPEIISKIATEKDVETIDQLKEWLKEKGHPIVGTWKEEEPKAEAAPAAPQQQMPTTFMMPTMELPGGAVPGLPSGMKIRVILKNAKIKAEKVIIRVEKE
ncbi:MAG TPA: CO dehydrogenase/CO-methylating acetyl-CoA synthase complex subunit beta [Candidatus Krumholzibacteriaceae bacterium]|nr:CO dehydrogenase/CO-methylating acetyl-CoA synthase complex subunit beta [Candidatus Krumholzibacteriaceae bacterium]